MPLAWKPWLISLLVANMIVPLFFWRQVEAQVIFATALVNGALFVVLTAISGFSRLLGLGHLPWIPLVWYLCQRVELHPPDSFYGQWLRAVILLNIGSLVLDAINVVRYAMKSLGTRQSKDAGRAVKQALDLALGPEEAKRFEIF